MTAAITAMCAEVDLCSARAISIGQPKTAPSVVKSTGRQRVRGSARARSLVIKGRATVSAINGLANAVKRGSYPRSANFVIGREAENKKTPRKAKANPFF
jgi:hypothetical protein